ncbi:hypothetical protein EV426DRAFT_594338 [Tirmania nivea]|nr:hypothetical protein EV426DRAFT_594338 [Tirmania nivea]
MIFVLAQRTLVLYYTSLTGLYGCWLSFRGSWDLPFRIAPELAPGAILFSIAFEPGLQWLGTLNPTLGGRLWYRFLHLHFDLVHPDLETRARTVCGISTIPVLNFFYIYYVNRFV